MSHSSTSLQCPIMISASCYYFNKFMTPGIRFLWARTKLSLASTGLLEPFLSSLQMGLCLFYFWFPEIIVKFCRLSYAYLSCAGSAPLDFLSGSSGMFVISLPSSSFGSDRDLALLWNGNLNIELGLILILDVEVSMFSSGSVYLVSWVWFFESSPVPS